MNRRELLGAMLALPLTSVSGEGKAMATEYRDSQITNGTSGLRIIQNSADDYSLKMISGDAQKDVTVVRYKGRTAVDDVSLAYQHLHTFLLLLGMDV